MNRTLRFVYQSLSLAATILVSSGPASGQIPGVQGTDRKPHAEISGLTGASGLLAFDGGAAVDGMWAVKAGAFGMGRLGIEGSFEQSVREPELRYLGADLMVHFPKKDPGRITPYVHVGAGSFLFGSHATGALSFGGGLKKFFNERVGIRVGVQDRMSIKSPEYHRLDFYGGIVLRF